MAARSQPPGPEGGSGGLEMVRGLETAGAPGRGGGPAAAGGDEAPSLLDPSGELRRLAGDCVHCGFCLPACPTYQLWGEEMDSPRGRIHLMTQLLQGAQAGETAAVHFDRCLGCMACVPACPSGVRYDRLIEAVRSWPEEPPAGPPPVPPRSLRDKAVRAAIFHVFPYPRRLRLASAPLRAAQLAGLDRMITGRPGAGGRRAAGAPTRPGAAERLVPELIAALRVAPRPRAAGAARPSLPQRVPARGPRRAVVGLLTGCVQRVFFPAVNAATARVLAAEGCDVVIPPGQGCCGALSLHGGRRAEAARFARRTVGEFERAGVDAVIVNAAGCGSAMKDYDGLLGGDADWSARAAALSGKVRDFSEFLRELGPAAPRHPLPVTAVYQDACHLGHAQGIIRQPRELLQGIPELRLAEIGDGGTCCGSAGIYNLVQPAAARQLGDRKAELVQATGAELMITANPGCALQISAALAAMGSQLPMAHIAEVLDASLRGSGSGPLLR